MNEKSSPIDLELERFVPLPEAARLSSLSVDTLKRHHADKIADLSPRRKGMKVRDVLNLSKSAAT